MESENLEKVKEFMFGKRKIQEVDWVKECVKDGFELLDLLKNLDEKVVEEIFDGYRLWKKNKMNRFSKVNRLLMNCLNGVEVVKRKSLYDEDDNEFILLVINRGIVKYELFEKLILNKFMGEGDKKNDWMNLNGNEILNKKNMICQIMEDMFYGIYNEK